MITLKTFVFNDFQENTYILHDETNQCIIIDPGCNDNEEKKELTDYIEKYKLVPKAIVNTHGHIDHVLGCKYVIEKYKIPFYAHKNELFLIERALNFGLSFGLKVEKPPLPENFLEDGQEYNFGNSTLHISHIPGHSPGSISLYNPEGNFVITGDVLFNGSIGRTDLPGGDFDTLINGIKNKLLNLPESTVVFPGHGPHTTIGDEIKYNAFLK